MDRTSSRVLSRLDQETVATGRDPEQIPSPMPPSTYENYEPQVRLSPSQYMTKPSSRYSGQKSWNSSLYLSLTHLQILLAVPSKYIQNLTTSHPSPPIHTLVQTPRFLQHPPNWSPCSHPCCPKVYSECSTSDCVKTENVVTQLKSSQTQSYLNWQTLNSYFSLWFTKISSGTLKHPAKFSKSLHAGTLSWDTHSAVTTKGTCHSLGCCQFTFKYMD